MLLKTVLWERKSEKTQEYTPIKNSLSINE